MSLKPVQADKLIRILVRVGFTPVRQRGSHLILRNSEGKSTVVPLHSGELISVGLLNQILKETGIARSEYQALLERA